MTNPHILPCPLLHHHFACTRYLVSQTLFTRAHFHHYSKILKKKKSLEREKKKSVKLPTVPLILTILLFLLNFGSSLVFPP
ncbi:hypothetical protein SLEP1_g46520 [Rubroshorea leprosula]|uniref:Uncharacterized protein n=1 Tax=Rubroshorea leprosula TaxID=152421 RepID=A0AAV5LMK4_9ROSI|nr:hypothetical protein SLEP1_g46520 [Rubroshorea leprosula]